MTAATAPIGADPARLQDLQCRALQVLEVTHAILPSITEIADAIEAVALIPDPWGVEGPRASITAVAARLAAANQALLGFLGEAGLVLADKSELAHGEALDLVRALEVKGETSHKGWSDEKNEANMGRYVDGITKAIVAFNGQIGAKDFHSAFKFSRGDSTNWSQEFSTEILPTLMNELKKTSKTDASQTGNALKSMSRVVMDGIATPDAINKWNALGLTEAGAFKKGKGGKLTKNPSWTSGSMVGSNVWQENPYQWVQDYLLPHMKTHGVDIGDRKSVVAALGGLFGNRVANHIAQILAIQQAQIKKDQDNIRKAQGTSGLDFLTNADPTMRMHVFAAALKELGSSIGDLALPGTMRGMKGIIDWAHGMAETVQRSAYGKKLGGYFESVMAGMFGQNMGRNGIKGRNPEYYGAGKMLGQGWSHFMSSGAKMMKFWEETGAFSGILSGTGKALNAIGTASDYVRTALEGVRTALGSQFVTDIKSHLTEAMNALPTELSQACSTIANALSGVGNWITKNLSWMLPSDAMAGDKGKKAGQAETDSRKILQGMGGGLGFGLRPNGPGPFGGLPSKSTFMDPGIKAAVDAATNAIPGMQQSGTGLAAALAAGIQGGGGQASASMSALMSSLTAIAAAGVTVPVKLDTSGAEAKLAGLMAKAGSVGTKGAGDGRFSKALSDTGN